MEYYFSVISFCIGLLMGFQGIFERHPTDAAKAALTLPGLFYLFTRGAVPASLFCATFGAHPFNYGPLVYSLAAGILTEALLRSQFYVRRQGTNASTQSKDEEVLKGGLDLLRWYQNFILDRIPVRLAESRKKFVRQSLPKDLDFPHLCELVRKNAEALTEAHLREKAEAACQKIEREYEQLKERPGADKIDETCNVKLGFELIKQLGRREFKMLVSP